MKEKACWFLLLLLLSSSNVSVRLVGMMSFTTLLLLQLGIAEEDQSRKLSSCKILVNIYILSFFLSYLSLASSIGIHYLTYYAAITIIYYIIY